MKTQKYTKDEFKGFLKKSLSLSKEEKVKILDNFSTFSDEMVSELVKIFTGEVGKWEEYEQDNKFKDQVVTLREIHKKDWEEIESELSNAA